ncbi:MAG: DUF3224 domain-containing protein [Acidobacteria bacterium]|nr:DUF3224 domain-containing protein [Acidobacteriota bacterium]
MKIHVSGAFEVKLTPQPLAHAGQDASLGRMSIDKRYQGALDATATGEMLSAMGGVKGSAVYVAIERVTGRLNGRAGSFTLAHRGVMSRAGQELLVTVAPDSGSGELSGLMGSMKIRIESGEHFYDFDGEVPDA